MSGRERGKELKGWRERKRKKRVGWMDGWMDDGMEWLDWMVEGGEEKRAAKTVFFLLVGPGLEGSAAQKSPTAAKGGAYLGGGQGY